MLLDQFVLSYCAKIHTEKHSDTWKHTQMHTQDSEEYSSVGFQKRNNKKIRGILYVIQSKGYNL